VLRLFAGPIVHKLNPLGLLFVAACCGAAGLYMLGSDHTGIIIWIAATIFAFGKSFYWGTMLGVIGERFPRGGALAMGFSGGIGMLSAGFLGGPGIGYTYDRHAAQELRQHAPDAYARVKSNEEKQFLGFQKVTGLDGAKVAVVKDNPPGKSLSEDVAVAKKNGKVDESLSSLNTWFQEVEKPHADHDRPVVVAADIYGGRRALQITAAVPVAMACCYLLLVIYFITRGGYKAVHLDSSGREVEVGNTPQEDEAYAAQATE
jgi:hypothetical protein